MDPGEPSIDALLAAAAMEFAQALPGKVTALGALVMGGAWQDARRAAHKLRGSASTYGHAELGAAAAAIEEELLAASGPPLPECRARIDEHLAEAHAEAARAACEAR